ncbi:hypothetical protein ACIBKY_22570 [Nonomuraea sp. NPDC050394]|uniref:hypothetical protein n=1 Tax=Nonomuraea sp. NPDC050394 TaxID=3364363 RepID=UPI0037A8537A
MTATLESPVTSVLERRYRKLLLAYPRPYRQAHGDELLDVLMESTDADRTIPPPREAAGLVAGGIRTRVIHLADGSVWRDGLHLGVTAVAVANLAALVPYAGSIPLWMALSALSVLAVLRGWVWAAIPLTVAVGVKAVAIAGGRQVAELTQVPVYPGLLTDRPLFADSDPGAVTVAYGLVVLGLLALAPRGGAPRVRSWWWWAAVPFLAWDGPAWMAEEHNLPISLSRMGLELALMAAAAVAGHLTRDLRWALGCAFYLTVTVAGVSLLTLPENGVVPSSQHLAYWALLGLLTAATALLPLRQRRHALD